MKINKMKKMRYKVERNKDVFTLKKLDSEQQFLLRRNEVFELIEALERSLRDEFNESASLRLHDDSEFFNEKPHYQALEDANNRAASFIKNATVAISERKIKKSI